MLGLGTLAPCLLGWREEQARSGPWTVLAPNSAPKWLKQTFDEADKNGDGSLSISEVLQLLHKLNVNLPRQRVKQMFRVSAERDGLCPPWEHLPGLQMGSWEWPSRPELWEVITGAWSSGCFLLATVRGTALLIVGQGTEHCHRPYLGRPGTHLLVSDNSQP